MSFSYQDIAKMIDHSLLNPTLTDAELEAGCRLARDYDVASVCIMPYYLTRCAELLAGSHGRSQHDDRLSARRAHDGDQGARGRAGARGRRRGARHGRQHRPGAGGDWAYVADDIRAVVDVAHAAGRKVKVIFENCLLARRAQDPALRNLRRGRRRLGQDLDRLRHRRARPMKICRLMRRAAPPHVQVKAAGGVRTLDRLLEVRALGVTRCGARRTVEMLEDARGWGCRRLRRRQRRERHRVTRRQASGFGLWAV